MKKTYPYIHYLVLSGICVVLVFLVPAYNLGFAKNSSNSNLKNASSTTTNAQTDNATRQAPPEMSDGGNSEQPQILVFRITDTDKHPPVQHEVKSPNLPANPGDLAGRG